MFRQMHKLLEFKNKELLYQALTHRSYRNEHRGVASDNERLEFFGDAILSFVSGEYLYQRHPEMAEGEMTRRRIAMVDEEQLAKFAIEMKLDSKMLLGQGARLDGGSFNPNLLSSTFEAVVGAYYLDKGCDFETIRPLIYELFDSVPQEIKIVRSILDPKNQFQAFVQKDGATTPPKYITEKKGGSDHRPEFVSKVYVGDKLCGEGTGQSKKDAEKQAAESALANLKKGR
jgi:ribonuclease III